MPLQATSGAASYDAFGGGVPVVPNYIEEVFSTYLYTGNGSTTTINNGIDVSGEGGLVWVKARANGNRSHTLFDSATYTTGQYYLATNITNGFLDTGVAGTFALNNSGFSVAGTSAQWNASGESFASWTFREQPKFFDVVTTTSQTVSHSLASVPGCVIWKRTDAAEDWNVVSRKADGSYVQLNLNLTDGAFASYANATAAGLTSTSVTLPSFSTGGTYVAYLFAHNAGGFGLTGTDNVISCGSYTGTGSNPNSITLGYEPQWILLKKSSDAANWYIFDNMRGMPVGSADAYLFPNDAGPESSTDAISPTATGFDVVATTGAFNQSGQSYIYIAIRRGPMKVPTSGTSVFYPTTYTGTGANNTITGFGFPPDLVLPTSTDGFSGYGTAFSDKLRGPYQTLKSNSTSSEDTITNGLLSFDQNGISVGPDNAVGYINWNTKPYVFWNFRRAPSFFDEVCYTGTGVNGRAISHNLGVAPELAIVKSRNNPDQWWVFSSAFAQPANNYFILNGTLAVLTATGYGFTTTSTTFTPSPVDAITANASGFTYVAYLFATCAGVSKVGSYTGNGSTQTINCGFTGGARFVLIKRTDSTGGWYVYDTARGMTTLTDPYLLLNSTAAETATLGSVTTVSTGFALNSTILAAINASGGSYIFFAVA